LILEQHRYIDLLTHKSPAWNYEHEVRMIYELHALKATELHKDVWLICQRCKALGRALADCEHKYHRDAVIIPDNAIRAVVFGNDCQHNMTAEILAILAEERYKHVEVYWCSLHSDKYELQYNKADAGYVRFIQEQRSKEIAFAKGHVRSNGNGFETKAAPKGVNHPNFGSDV
jgi:hypothetical protein